MKTNPQNTNDPEYIPVTPFSTRLLTGALMLTVGVLLAMGWSAYDMWRRAIFFGATALLSVGLLVFTWLKVLDRLQQWRAALARADAALRGAREDLEKRVEERTRELQQINHKLQTDVVEHKRAEEALHRSEESLRSQSAALEAAANAIVITDCDGTIQSVNPAFTTLTGYTAPEAVGQNPRILKGGKQDEAFYRKLWQTISSGQVWSGELTNRRKDGSLYVEEMTITPVRNADGTIARYIAIKQDVTERKRAEEALQASQQIIEGILNAIPVRVFWKDKNLVYLGCNAVFARDSGFADPKDIIGKDDYEMGWCDQAEAYRKDDRQTIESGDSRLNMEEPQTTPDGKTITLLTNKIPLRNSKGEISGVLGTYMDITARKRAEEALRQSEERFAGAFEHAPIGVALVSPDGRWLKVNHALCELVGYSEAELLTRTFQDLTPPGDLADDLEHVRRIIAGEIHSYQIEKRYVHARGHLITTLLSVSLVRDGRGQPLYFISQIQDITDRKRAEETLRKTEARLAHAMSLAQLFAWEYDMASGLFTFSNRYYVLHGTTAEQEGGNLMSAPDFVRRFVHPEDAHLIAEEVGKAAATTDPNYRAQLECRVFRRDRELRYVLVNIAVTKDAAGKTIKLNGANQDITELKQAEANLEKINNELVVASRLAGMAEVATSVLHNVGNVLNSVGVSATLVANQVRHTKAVNIAKVAALFDQHQADLAGFLATDPRGQTLPAYLGSLAESIAAEQATLLAELAYLRKNIEHIKDIVAMQQAYAQISGGTVTVSIPDLLEEALRINADALARYDVTTIRDYQARPVIATDKHKVLQILINLVRNAELACVDSGRTDKQITVRTTSDDHSVKIAIVDNGVGIPAENLTRIFNHGFTTRKTGHGFALHSGALAARELGGALTVQSDGAGLGATFTLELPYQPDTPAHENSVR